MLRKVTNSTYLLVCVTFKLNHSKVLTSVQNNVPNAYNMTYVVAMLVELTIEANEESFVIVHQHGSNDVTCK